MFPEEKGSGGVAIGLPLVCSWSGTNVGVLWRDGKIKEIGPEKTGIPRSYW